MINDHPAPVEAQIPTHNSPCGIYVEQSVTETDCLRIQQPSPASTVSHLSIYNFMYQSQTLHRLSIWQRRFRLPLRCTWDLRSYGILRSVDWQSVTEVSVLTFQPKESKKHSSLSAWILNVGLIDCPETSSKPATNPPCVTSQKGRRSQLKESLLNRLTPNDSYMGRTAPLTSKRCILYTEWPKKMYTLFTHQYLWNKFKWNFYFRVRV